LINYLLFIHYKDNRLKCRSHKHSECSESTETTEKRQAMLPYIAHARLRSILWFCPETMRYHNRIFFQFSLSLSFRIHRKLICRENCFFDVNTMRMRRIDKLSGSDDCPFCRWKISIVECFDVHESLLLMLSSQTGFNASPLSIARLECATTGVSITSSVRSDVHRETYSLLYSFVIIK